MQSAMSIWRTLLVQPRQPTSRDALAMPRFCTRVVPRRFLRDTWESWSCNPTPLKSANHSVLDREAVLAERLASSPTSGLWLAAHPACKLHNVLAVAACVHHGGGRWSHSDAIKGSISACNTRPAPSCAPCGTAPSTRASLAACAGGTWTSPSGSGTGTSAWATARSVSP
jgi:hypothetical protein